MKEIYGICPICGINKNNLFKLGGEIWNRCDDHRLFWMIDGCYTDDEATATLEKQIKEAVFLSENNYYRCCRVTPDDFQKNEFRKAEDVFIGLKELQENKY